MEQEIRKGQLDDAKIKEIKDLITVGRVPEFTEDEQGTIWFKDRICVHDIGSLRETILKEAHDSDYSIHPGSTKMYRDLKHIVPCSSSMNSGPRPSVIRSLISCILASPICPLRISCSKVGSTSIVPPLV